MLTQYVSTVKVTIRFLKLLSVKVNNSTVNETLQNHPDWPSLLCISDSLEKWNIPNAGAKIQMEYIESLPLPFLAPIHDTEDQMVIVTQTSNTHISYCSDRLNKSVTIEKSEFFKKWGGVYLIAEPDCKSGERDYVRVKYRSLFKTLIPIMLLLILFTFSFVALLSMFRRNTNPVVFVQYFTYLSGVVVSSLLLWYEIDRNNPILKRVCTSISKGSCETILTSPAAKLFGWLSWSEIGFFYFAGSLLALLFVFRSIGVLSWLSLSAMPYIIFSLYYQGRIIRRWCILCLIVQALLLINGISTLTAPFLKEFDLSETLLRIAGCYLLPIFGWYSLKPYCLKLQSAVTIRREYLRIKFNAEIFDTLLRKQKAITIPAADLGINLGKTGASHTLIKVCNPYCGPCANAHPKIDKLLENHKNLRVRIIFTAPNDNNNLLSKPVRHLLAISEKQDELLVKKALDDWYLAEKKDYEVFAARYPLNIDLHAQGFKLAAMSNWCKEMDILITPTFFLDGNELPDMYNIEDLEYFLLE